MLTRITDFLLENKIFATLVIVLILFFGIITSPFDFGLNFFPRNPVSVDAIPNIGENQQIVFTSWEGKSPRDIEDQITYPLTSHLMGIPGVKSVRSNSMFGFSNIYLIFEDDVDFYWARTRILERLNTIPKNVLPEEVNPKLGPDATPLGQVFWYTLEGRDEYGHVTGGWDLQEVRSIQDFYVKNALASSFGVSEVASIGGHIKEYQIDLDPELMKQYGVSLNQLVQAVNKSNQDIGAKTLEINRVEYFVRGLGFVKSIEDIENTAIVSEGFSSIRVKDVAKVTLGPAERRGILDKGGAEVVGGVVTTQYSVNPMEALKNLEDKISEIQPGMPSKVLDNGKTSKLTIVPFYDRSELIDETLQTLSHTLLLEILVAILVVLAMISSFRASVVIASGLPLAVLVVFSVMRVFNVDANIVALAGIAIAIGTMVDMGIILVENIIQRLQSDSNGSIKDMILTSTREMSGAIVTAGLTTIVSFIPVFSLTGAEGKLFIPLAFTKTAALAAAMAITIFILPVLVQVLFRVRKPLNNKIRIALAILWVSLGLVALFYQNILGLLLVVIGALDLLWNYQKINLKQLRQYKLIGSVVILFLTLGLKWMPLGYGYSVIVNLIFVLVLAVLILLPIFFLFRNYEKLLTWVLDHKMYSIAIPLVLILLGGLIMANSGKEFMPALDEGDYLLMPTSMPHTGISESKSILAKLDMAVSALPEVEYVVGKSGRAESPLDPAPLFMYENVISYKSEYLMDEKGKPIRFRINEQGLFETKQGGFVEMASNAKPNDLIRDSNGAYYRNWRPHVRNTDDIWDEITSATHLPGVTTAPKLHPIQTRLVMLQTGMRSPFGIKIKGQNLTDIEDFGLQLESILRETKGIKAESVFADRITGKPYLVIDINREKIARYGLSIQEVQQTLELGIGGKTLTNTVEGRERYAIRIRYPRELRDSPVDLENMYVNAKDGVTVPLKELVDISYEKGPQMIKSEDGFLVGYVTFDKTQNISEVDLIEEAGNDIDHYIEYGQLTVPTGINWEFSGTYENHLHAQKTLLVVIPLTLLIILVILYFRFRSFSISLMVFSGVAVAFAGGFILIWLYGQPWFLNFDFGSLNLRDAFNVNQVHLSVAVWVGFIALFGIATDDGVIMATLLKQSFDSNEPKDIAGIRTAVIAAGKRRIRACLMTTATTLLALLPILTSTGRGSDIMIPMTIPCFGGMLMALISLFVVPLLFCWEKELILNRDSQHGRQI